MLAPLSPRLIVLVFAGLAAFLAGRFVEFGALPLGAIAVAALAASLGVALSRVMLTRTP